MVRRASRLLGSVADGEDAAQEAYVRAYRALEAGQFDGRSSVETWLYRVLTNVALDALRARQRRAALVRGERAVTATALAEGRTDTLGPHAGGEREAVARVALKELGALLDALPPEQRVALTLSAVEGLSSREIAAAMGTTEGAVEQRLVRARALLRAKAGEKG